MLDKKSIGNQVQKILRDRTKGTPLEWIPDNIVFLTLSGSHAYGTSTPASDIDVRGLVIPPLDFKLSYINNFENLVINTPMDITVYDITKATKLIAENNPNMIELLYVDPSSIIFETETYCILRENRDLFLSKKSRHSFAGYANSQLKRMQRRMRWICDAPPEVPEKESFVTTKQLTETTTIDSFLQKEYEAAMREYTNYLQWYNERNDTRKELERKFGYDCKNATHLLRLLNMCVDILEHGTITVLRPDSEFLRDVRNGKYTYDQVIKMAAALEQKCEALYSTTTLQKESKRVAINKLLISLQKKYWGIF